jgi:dTDP-4-dehydrorhamnose reductase
MGLTPTRTLVTGAGGMLGQDLTAALAAAGQAYTALSHGYLDITDPGAVAAAVPGHDVVINAAAWTDVDAAETNEEAATLVNGDGVANLARACATSGAVLLHVSTDAVFNGNRSPWHWATPYAEEASTCPINAYGRSKLVGEQAVLNLLPERGYVVRTAWLYGAHGRNFIHTLLLLVDRHFDPIEVVADQWGQPTWTMAVARRLLDLAGAALDGTAPPGIYHATATGAATWYDLAREVFHLAGMDTAGLTPVPLAQHHRAAPQSPWSVLGQTRWAHAGLPTMPHWPHMLAQAWKDIRP